MTETISVGVRANVGISDMSSFKTSMTRMSYTNDLGWLSDIDDPDSFKFVK